MGALVLIAAVLCAGSACRPREDTASSSGSRTAQPTQQPSRTPTSRPPERRRTAVLVAAGDIACNPLDNKFEGRSDEETGCRQRATARLIGPLHPTVVMPLGDTQYQHGGYGDFLASYAPSWGKYLPITRPVIGNHEYETPRAAGYFGYFGRAAGDARRGYYSFEIGRWHAIVLNSACKRVGGCDAGSPQERWLRRDLATHGNRCTLAAWHEPRFSSGAHEQNPELQRLWADLHAARAEVVLAGHDHDYERFAPLDAHGRPQPRRGVRSFVVGTGGVGLRGFRSIAVGSEVRQNYTFGVLALTLRPSDYDWRFVPVGANGFRDSGSGTCH
jgi:hypothetical protein